MRIHPDLGGDQIDRILERIEDNEATAKALSTRPVTTGFLSDSPGILSQAQAVGALRQLAENGLLHAKLLGRDVLPALASTQTSATSEASDNFLLTLAQSKTGANETIGSLLRYALGDVVLAVIDDDKDAQARLKGRTEPTEVLQALVG